MLNAIDNNFCYSPVPPNAFPSLSPKTYQGNFLYFLFPQGKPLNTRMQFFFTWSKGRQNLDIIKLTARLFHDARNDSVRCLKGCFNLMHSQAHALNFKTALITFVQFSKIASSLRSDAIFRKNNILTSFVYYLKTPLGSGPNNSWYRGEAGWLTLYYCNPQRCKLPENIVSYRKELV